MMDWDDAFNNMGHVSGSEALPGLWERAAFDYRNATNVETDLAYGDADRHKLDIVWPDATPRGLAVFVHGGFWMRLSKSYWTHYAEGARAQGWAVCFPSYTLAPQARLSHMTEEIASAISFAARRVEGPIRLAGHSAGGHLVSRMVCATSPLAAEIRDRISHTLSISGLHDLRPLMWTKMNDILQIDDAEALRESAALLRPSLDTRLTAWVGGGERSEFIRQTQLLALMWRGLEAEVSEVIEGDHNHFTILEDLQSPNTPITKAFVGE